ncbi:MAG TPA: PAS domain-containing protein [Gammaproteobacteria bacterium]|nr:PAS domain-containing protein [Gammaproteobacteria bacterium]
MNRPESAVTASEDQLAARLEVEVARARSYDQLLSAVPDLACIFDLDHRFTFANRAMLALWGRTRDEAIGKTFHELGYPARHAEMLDREIDKVIATRQTVKGEAPFSGADGHRIYEYIFVPILGPGGEVEAVGGTTRDVTDRRQREEHDNFLVGLSDALHCASDSSEIMEVASRMIGSHMGVGRCGYGERLGESGECFRVERDWTDGEMPSLAGDIRLSDLGPGLERDFHLGRTVRLEDWLTDERTRGVKCAYLGKGNARSGIGVPLVKKDRLVAIFYVHQKAPRIWTDNEVALVEEVGERTWEAVERIRAEDALRESENRLHALAIASTDVLFRVSADWSEMRELRGQYFPDEMAEPNRNWLNDYIPPQDQQRVMRAINEAIRGRSVFKLTHRIRRKDGTLGWTHSRAVPLFDKAGQICEWFGSATDITLRKKAELSLHKANRAKDEFLAMLGHELRNPLSPIMTALQLMRMRSPDAAVRERTIIEKQVRHMAGLVDDLLDVARIVRGKIELKRQPVDLGELIVQAIETVDPLIERRQQRVETTIDGTLVVDGDPRRLLQVVTNLLTNAAKYSPSQRTIRVSAQADGSVALLRVRDEGIGIEPDLLPLVFDLFTQSAQSIDRSEGGLGLGLALVRNLVELHGGSVEARSEGQGRGSEFIVRLPRIELSVVVKEEGTKPGARREREAVGSRLKPRVLIVDDYEDVADSTAELLEMQDFETRVAYNGAAALKLAGEFEPAVALIDIGLPVMDGYEVARRLRQMSALKNLVLVAMSGYGQDRDRARAMDAGFDRHMVKPIDPAKIGQMIEEFVFSRIER